MYLFIFSALAGFILCSVGLAMLIRIRGEKADHGIPRSSYWFAAAAAVVFVGAVPFFRCKFTLCWHPEFGFGSKAAPYVPPSFWVR
jgi:hypothetical protein